MIQVLVCHIAHFLILLCNYMFLLLSVMFQRSSVSPAEREKYRTRSPDVDPDLKRRKEDKLGGHVSSLIDHCLLLDIPKHMWVIEAVCIIWFFFYEDAFLGPL
jgi:hypothetical protein